MKKMLLFFLLISISSLYGQEVALDNSKTSPSEVRISPNPAKSFVVVTHIQAIRRIAVLSITGQVIIEQSFDDARHTHRIDVSLLRRGAYFIRIETDGRIVTRKLLKN